MKHKRRTNADALREQVDQLRSELVKLRKEVKAWQAAAQAVIDNWAEEDGNDLAGAVNELESLLPE